MPDIQEITTSCAKLVLEFGAAAARMSPRPSPEALMAALARCAASAIAIAPGGTQYSARFFAQRLKADLERMGVFTNTG